MPWVHVTGSQNDLRIGIGLDQLLRKGTGRPVTDGLAVTQELVPFFAAELADSVVLRVQGIVPHQAVRRVLNTCAHHVVALAIAQALKSLAESCEIIISLYVLFPSDPVYTLIYTKSNATQHLILTGSSGTANTQSQDLHRHSAVAFPAVNVCIIGEDVGNGLGSQIIGEHERHGGCLSAQSQFDIVWKCIETE